MSPKDTNAPTRDESNRKKINAFKGCVLTPGHVKIAMASLDLTSLTGQEAETDIINLCNQAKEGNVAAVCVYPQYVGQVTKLLEGTGVQIATVINFPSGNMTNDGEIATPDNTYDAVQDAIANGATEIDIVIDYRNYMDESHTRSLLRSCKKACGRDVAMKVILETAAFELEGDIECLASIAIEEGANFIKTSTGKYNDPEFPEVGGATFEAVLTMVDTIKKYKNERTVGLKISGGVNDRNFSGFIELVKRELSEEFMTPDTFRIGASSLYNYLKLSIETKGAVLNHVQKHETLGY